MSFKPGDKIEGREYTFVVSECVDGHVWGNIVTSLIPGECCWVCGLVRRRDRQNKPCKGRPRLELR